MSRDQVDRGKQEMVIDRVCTESGGKRELRLLHGKIRAAVRTVVIPDLALPAVRRLLERDQYAFDSQPVLAPIRQLRQTEDTYLASPEYFA